MLLPLPETPVMTVNRLRRKIDIDILEIVLARAADLDGRRRGRMSRAIAGVRARSPTRGDRQRGGTRPVCASSSARPVCEPGSRMRSSGVPAPTMLPPASPPSGPRSMIQSAARDHIQIVLDDQQRMAGLDQAPEGAQQLRDIVEMQSGGRFIEQEQRAASRRARGLVRARALLPRTAFSAR